MQYGHSTGFRTKMRVAKRSESLPHSGKKQIVIPPLVVQANGVQVVRNGKDQMVMFHGQGFLHQIIDPEGLSGSLAFGTMAIAATVVTVTDGSAVLTGLFMTAQGCSPANSYLIQHFQLQWSKLCFVSQRRTEQTDYIGQFKGCPHFPVACFFFPGKS
jgi:hypothetical protein